MLAIYPFLLTLIVVFLAMLICAVIFYQRVLWNMASFGLVVVGVYLSYSSFMGLVNLASLLSGILVLGIGLLGVGVMVIDSVNEAGG